MDEMYRVFIQVVVSVVTTAVGFLGGVVLEKLKQSNAKELEEQKGKQNKEAILYKKRMESYETLLDVLSDFNEKAQDAKLMNSEQISRPAADEVESAWKRLNQTVRVGVYSDSVSRELNTYLRLDCWEPLLTQNVVDPEAPRIADPLAFWNAALNTMPNAYILIIRDAINRDLEQLQPAQYEVR